MLSYQNIHNVNKAQRRLKNGYRWHAGKETEASDRLLMFTLGVQAERDSQANFDAVMQVARDSGQQLVIIRDHKIQLAGSVDGSAQRACERLFTRDWLKGFNQWVDSLKWPTSPVIESSGRGEYLGFQHYRHCLALSEHVGVYDVDTGKKLTNRREIIQRYWDLGFAAWRGRPVSIAQLKWSGTREELEELSELADRYWHRGVRGETEVGKRIVSSFRSINRYAAWPGAW